MDQEFLALQRAQSRLYLIEKLDTLELFSSRKLDKEDNTIVLEFKRSISISEEELSLITIPSGRNSPVNNYPHRVKSNSVGGDEELQFIMDVPGKRIDIESSSLKITFTSETDDKADICFLNEHNKENNELIQNEKPMNFQEILYFLEKISLVN